MRLVTHYDVDREGCELALAALAEVAAGVGSLRRSSDRNRPMKRVCCWGAGKPSSAVPGSLAGVIAIHG